MAICTRCNEPKHACECEREVRRKDPVTPSARPRAQSPAESPDAALFRVLQQWSATAGLVKAKDNDKANALMVSRLDAHHNEVKTGMVTINTTVSELSDSVSNVKATVTDLSSTVTDLKSSYERMRSDVFNKMEAQDAKINSQKAEHDERLSRLEKSNGQLQDVISELKEALEQGRTLRSPSEKSFSNTSINSDDLMGNAEERFVPNHIYIRGFSPYGSDSSSKIKIAEYETHAKKLRELLPAQYQRNIIIDAPYPRNFQISFRVPGGRDRCFDVKNFLQQKIDEKDYRIKDCGLKVSVQLSAERKLSLSSFYTALRHVEQNNLSIGTFGHSVRALEIFTEPNAETIGRWDKESKQWVWDKETCQNLSIQTVDIQAIKSQ